MEQAIGIQASKPLPEPLSVPSATAVDPGQGARAFYGILKFTPLLWLGGLLPFCTPLVICWVFLRDRCWKHLKDPAIAGWFAIGGIQAFCTFLNWANTDDGISAFIYRCFSAPISGWIFLGMLMAIGKAFGSEIERLSRGVCLIGIYILLFGLPLLAFGLATGTTELLWLTPVGHLIPASLPSAQFEFTAQFLIVDDFVAQTVPRLVLFYPWPTCLGFAGAVTLFISLSGRRDRWTIFGFCGGLFGLFASTSRAAIIGTILGLSVFGIFRVTKAKRPPIVFGLVTLLCFGLWLPTLFGTDPLSLMDRAATQVSAVRQDSSTARDQLYKETYRQFKDDPIIGHGWQGNILEDTIPLNIGSHSTIYGLLYTGGAVTLFAFLTTAIVTGVRLVRAAAQGGKLEQSALGIFIVLIVMCYGECIYSFAIPVFFTFLWIGAGVGDRQATSLRLPGDQPMDEYRSLASLTKAEVL